MRFDPMGDLFPDGEYKYEVMKAEEQQSQAGNDMIKLEVKIFDARGRSTIIFNYLLGGNYRLKHICSTNGLLGQFKTGQVDAHMLVGLKGVCKVGIDKGKPGKDGKMYDDKNTILDYLPPDTQPVVFGKQQVEELMPASNEIGNDDLPF